MINKDFKVLEEWLKLLSLHGTIKRILFLIL